MTEQKEKDESFLQNKMIVFCIFKYIAFLFFLYSTVSVIWCLYLYFFIPEDFFAFHLLGHLYGAFVSNLLLLATNIPKE